ncbi:type II toxin-antitoxin system MqsA family antitoxin [Paucibacter sp. KCTC 42545]|uniref:type II toxin-antitoxin system MqsA family antitoxin n=1 Tax=Paucibacter sp. KCTC 42545 TaxID=1768242 RepID=UPI0009EBFDCF|nr:type II toxin-antitoxin system MqsA family antitoxin [Paucibacter sp. KCTC 42545]
MSANELCSVCGEGHVTNHADQIETEYKGKKGLVPMHYKCCDACGSDFASADESRLNKRAVLAFRKSVDGLLSGAEICALRNRFGINQKQAARLFGGGPVAFSKYENDDVAHSESMDKLLRLVLKSEQIFWSLVEQEGMVAELAPKGPKQVSGPRKVFRSTATNVIQVEFGNGFSAPTLIAATHRYQPADELNEDLRWKH